jgi:hypothetical protein
MLMDNAAELRLVISLASLGDAFPAARWALPPRRVWHWVWRPGLDKSHASHPCWTQQWHLGPPSGIVAAGPTTSRAIP